MGLGLGLAVGEVHLLHGHAQVRGELLVRRAPAQPRLQLVPRAPQLLWVRARARAGVGAGVRVGVGMRVGVGVGVRVEDEGWG